MPQLVLPQKYPTQKIDFRGTKLQSIEVATSTVPGTQEGLTKIQLSPSSLGQCGTEEKVGHTDPDVSGAIRSTASILFLHLSIGYDNASSVHGKIPRSNFRCLPKTMNVGA